MHTEPATTAQQSHCSSQNSGYKLFGTHRALKMGWGGGCSSLFSVIPEIQSSLLFRLDAHLCPACRVKPLPGESAPTCHTCHRLFMVSPQLFQVSLPLVNDSKHSSRYISDPWLTKRSEAWLPVTKKGKFFT